MHAVLALNNCLGYLVGRHTDTVIWAMASGPPGANISVFTIHFQLRVHCLKQLDVTTRHRPRTHESRTLRMGTHDFPHGSQKPDSVGDMSG